MLSAVEALGLILESVRPLPAEEARLEDSLHRVLAESVIAPIDLPGFDNAAMDGFAVRSIDTRTAAEGYPARLKVLRTIPAGDRGGHCLMPLQSGQAVRIMTGAPVPEGADAVIPFEEASVKGDACLIDHAVEKGRHVRKAGEDVPRGTTVLDAGVRITPRTVAVLAALGLSQVKVFRRPTVRILSTGNELANPGNPLAPGQIYNSNGPALAAAFRELGIEARLLDAAADTEEALTAALKDMEDTDVLITVGGVSAGDFDLVPKVLKDLGANILFHKVAIKPGKPLLVAVRGRTHIFALPGNPVSALMVFDRFVRPALLKMTGHGTVRRPSLQAVAAQALKGTPDKEDYLRGVVTYEDGRYVARSAGAQGSAMLASLARANAVLVIPASQRAVTEGEAISFEFLSEVV